MGEGNILIKRYPVQEQNKEIVDNNLLPPNCSLGSCLGLTGEISCIVSAIASGDSTALQKCLSNSVSEVCMQSFISTGRLGTDIFR